MGPASPLTRSATENRISITARNKDAGRRIRLGMVGGGQSGFIGAVHRYAARLDGHYKLVAGALSSDPMRAKASGEDLGLATDRIYSDREKAHQKHDDDLGPKAKGALGIPASDDPIADVLAELTLELRRVPTI